MQRYRADYAGDTCPNGAIPWLTKWIGGPSLALVKNCPLDRCEGDENLVRRTVYVQGPPDTYFSQPAAAKILGNYHPGYLTHEKDGWVFHPYEAVNLDDCDEEELAAIAKNGRFYGKTSKLYHDYAEGKIYAIALRKSGDIEKALSVESVLFSIYREMPKWARW